MSAREKPVIARADRVLPGVWRLRLPLPWPGVPHGNAYAVASGEGIVLFDTGVGGEDGRRQLELALSQAGFGLADVRLVACTHTHADHYGLAATIARVAGCEVWLHPAWGHIRRAADDPEAALEHRLEIARQAGVPRAGLELYERSSRGRPPLFDAAVPPDRELLPGVEVETDLGAWQVHETPGHAPSHVCFHQPERRLLISGDHLLGRIALFYDQGHTPDPMGEFLGGLDTIEPLDVGLVLAGHGRPFRDAGAKIRATRQEAEEQLDRVRRAVVEQGPVTAFEAVGALIGEENRETVAAAWGLQMVLAYLDRLRALGEAEPVPGTDPVRWRTA